MRIVSLVPSSTETLLALGADVVACTRFCEQPDLPHVGGTKNPDIAAIVAATPDLVVLDRQENRREDADALAEAGLRTWVSDVDTVAGAHQLVEDLAELIDVEPPPTVIGPPAGQVSSTAFVPIWRRPWMSINDTTYGADILRHVGCGLVTGDRPDPYPEVDLDEVAAASPDMVLVPSEPYSFGDGHIAELQRTFTGSRVLRVDGQDLFWWGIRTGDAIDRIAAVIGALPRADAGPELS